MTPSQTAIKAAAAVLAPPPELTVSEWADQNRVLVSESSAAPGRWKTQSFQREPMDAIGSDNVHTLVLMWCSQMGKSEILFNRIGFVADMDPAPQLMMQPTKEMAEGVSKDRIAPMIAACPTLRDKFGDPKSKVSNNTLLHKKYPGGFLQLIGGNSPSSMASRPIRDAYGDEIDRLPESAGTEGDPWKLVEKRTSTFWNRKKMLTSTPTIEGQSRIKMAFEAGDQRRYFLPCPHCGEFQHLEWSGIQWAKNENGYWDQTAPWYICKTCGARIDETEKPRMLDAGEWRPTAEPLKHGFRDPGIRSYHLNELYSPWRSWAEIVADFFEAKGDTELMQVWTNTCMGETFEEAAIEVDRAGLMARAEQYPAEVPAGGLVLTCGVDTQDDRLELQVDAWGAGEENWRIDYQVFYGDPDRDEVWTLLDDFLMRKRYKHESGANLGIASTCIDSGGHKTQRVYQYCRGKLARRIFAIKGMAGFDRPMLSAPSHRKTGRQKRHVDLWIVGVDSVKSSIYSRLEIEDPGPGYIHFPISEAFNDEYFNQLTGEKIVTKMHMGRPVRHWKQKRDRVEALDCSVYSYAALIQLNPNLEALAARMAPRDDDDEDGPDGGGRMKARKKLSSPRRRGFANNWR